MTHPEAMGAEPKPLRTVGWAYRGPRGGLIVTEGKPSHAPEAKAVTYLADAQALSTQVQRLTEENEALRKERDEAQANAYRSDKAADALNAATKDAGDRAADMWRKFRDLRTEIIGDGPMCRDCADFDGRCQGNGPPCDPDEAVKEKIATWKAAEARIKALEEEKQEVTDLILTADRFKVGMVNGYPIHVVSRGPSQWAVSDGGFVLTRTGEWEAEPQPSSRTDEFIARTRFTFAEAMGRARALSSTGSHGK